MKKSMAILSLFVLTLVFAPRAKAQYAVGQIDLNLGIGLIPTFGVGTGGLPISVSGEYGITEEIGVGAYLGYSRSRDNLFLFGDATYSYLIFGARGSYHFDVAQDPWDLYAGAMLGYNRASVTYQNAGAGLAPEAASGITYSLFAGARYRFTDQIGAFGELGYGISIINLGLTLKL